MVLNSYLSLRMDMEHLSLQAALLMVERPVSLNWL